MSRRRRRNTGLKIILFIVIVCVTTGVIYWKMEPVTDKIRNIVNEKSSIPFTENTIEESAVATQYYYQQLSEDEKIVYKEILQGVQEEQGEIYLHTTAADRVGAVYTSVIYDFPELFWCTGEASTTSYNDYSVMQPLYACTGETREQMKAGIEQAADVCISGMDPNAGTYDKVKYIYEYIVNTTDYDINAEYSQNIYSVLVNKVSVCAGYSRTMQYLLQKCGIEGMYVTGVINETMEAHAWNIVNCDGGYYQVDVTWGDPVFLQQEEDTAQPESNINYDYLCCTDSEIYKTHTVDTEVVFPACTSMAYNYYILNGMYYDTFDADICLNAMNDTIYSGGPQTVFKFANDEVYHQAHDMIINDLLQRAAQNLLQNYGLMQTNSSYIDDPQMDKIVIMWSYQ